MGIFTILKTGQKHYTLQKKNEHNALVEKQKAQQLFLDQLNQDKKKLMEFIRMKTQERDSKRQIVAYDWAEDLIKCPEEILNQLHQNIANSTNPITFFNSTY